MPKPQFHPLRVADVEPLTDDSVAITFEVPPELADAYRFTHGQHLTIRGDDGERRSFSICTTPSSQRLTIGVKKLPGGVFSQGVVDHLHPGDELDVMTPAGRFTTVLDPASERSYVAIAAGSGITPVISIVSTILESEPAAQRAPAPRPVPLTPSDHADIEAAAAAIRDESIADAARRLITTARRFPRAKTADRSRGAV